MDLGLSICKQPWDSAQWNLHKSVMLERWDLVEKDIHVWPRTKPILCMFPFHASLKKNGKEDTASDGQLFECSGKKPPPLHGCK